LTTSISTLPHVFPLCPLSAFAAGGAQVSGRGNTRCWVCRGPARPCFGTAASCRKAALLSLSHALRCTGGRRGGSGGCAAGGGRTHGGGGRGREDGAAGARYTPEESSSGGQQTYTHLREGSVSGCSARDSPRGRSPKYSGVRHRCERLRAGWAWRVHPLPHTYPPPPSGEVDERGCTAQLWMSLRGHPTSCLTAPLLLPHSLH
jgi:hypothetical protein